MAENPRFNNSGMFTNINSDDYSDITPDSTSEVLATQGNVINSIKVFWNKLKAKLAYAVTRGDTEDGVGSNWCPIYVDASGEVKECNATMLTVGIEGTGNVSATAVRDITTPHTGTTAYLNISRNSATNNTYSFKINGKVVKYVSGVEVKAGDINGGDKLVLAYAKDSGSAGFWLLLNKVNNAGTSAGLMTAADKQKLDGIAENANNYILPIAGSNLGGVKSAATGTTANRDYNVQINSNGTMKVNVPWTDTNTHDTAYLMAGTKDTNANNSAGDGATYLKIVDNGAISSQVLIKGSNGAKVTSDTNGITIEGPGTIPSYNKLSSTQNSPSKGYLVKGAGDYATSNYYLRGDGTWGAPAASMGRMDASISNGQIDMASNLNTTLTVTYNGSPIQFAFIGTSTYKVSSSNGSLFISSVKVSSNINSDTTALIVPMGNLSLKPQILHFISQTNVEFLD